MRHFDDYVASLEKAKVVLDPARRREIILNDAKNLAFAQGFELVEDEGLLNEVAGLVEWPVVLMGTFEESFLSIPGEVIRATIRNNQKCFVVRDPATAKLTNRFILTSNIEAADGGKEIIAGNARVIRARLSDAKFFYETDLKIRLEERLPKFKDIIFHEKLGTQYERIERIARLAVELAPLVGADPEKAKTAALLCKTDLLTEVVGEFPEVQGTMGKYYALAQGEDAAVAHAIEEHYKPQGPDDLRAGRSGVDRGRARRQDRHAGRILGDRREADWEQGPICAAPGGVGGDPPDLVERDTLQLYLSGWNPVGTNTPHRGTGATSWRSARSSDRPIFSPSSTIASRSSSAIRARATISSMLFSRSKARAATTSSSSSAASRRSANSLATDDGASLLAGYKRATNILRIEEKKDGRTYHGRPDSHLYLQPEERQLAAAINAVKEEAAKAVAREDFEGAMAAIAKLRADVDAFFDKVTVNVPAADRRENRLKLLNEIREATRAVADFSRIEG